MHFHLKFVLYFRPSVNLSPNSSISIINTSSTMATTVNNQTSGLSSSVGTPSSSFVMPAYVPSKEEWVRDDEVNECMVCSSTRFGLLNRRHHCRRCGRVVCAACSQKTTLIDNVMRRTCDDCYRQIEAAQSFFSGGSLSYLNSATKSDHVRMLDTLNESSLDETSSLSGVTSFRRKSKLTRSPKNKTTLEGEKYTQKHTH